MNQFIKNIQDLTPPSSPYSSQMLLATFHKEHCSELLSQKNQFELPQKFKKFGVARQAEFMAGRHLAACALKDLGNPFSQILLHEQGYPIWPVGFSGSISHKQDQVVTWLIKHDQFAVGIDIENWISTSRSQLISKKILTEKERDPLEGLTSDRWLTFIFSAKETFYKVLNPVVKKFFGFHDASVIHLDWKKNSYQIQLNVSLNSDFKQGDTFQGSIHQLDHGLITYQSISLNSA